MRASRSAERLRAARESLREVARGLSRRYRPGVEPLLIAELISPLRYDVEVRSRFFEFLAQHRDLYERDPSEFVSAVAETDYHVWFRQVAVHAIGIAELSPAELDLRFERRVRRSVALAESVAAKGFVPRPLLTVRSSPGTVTSTAKHLGLRHYPLDGCHRLALLRQLGRTELVPGEYRVTDGGGALLDNTFRLLPSLGLEASRYYRFIASGYGADDAETRDQLLAMVRERNPDRVAEVESILAADESALGFV